jgi:hypothetical protein
VFSTTGKTWFLTTGWRERAGGPIRRDEIPVEG